MMYVLRFIYDNAVTFERFIKQEDMTLGKFTRKRILSRRFF